MQDRLSTTGLLIQSLFFLLNEQIQKKKKILRPYLMTENAKHWVIGQKQESFAWNSYIIRELER